MRNTIVDRFLGSYKLLGEPECIFRWLILPERFTGESFESQAYESGVQVYSAERFAVGNAKSTRAVRLAIAAPENISKLEESLVILKEILEK